MKKLFIAFWKGENRYALLDDEDYDRMKGFSWTMSGSINCPIVQKRRKKRGFNNRIGKDLTGLKRNRESMTMQRAVLRIKKKYTYVKFLDGNRFNFQKSNLKILEKK